MLHPPTLPRSSLGENWGKKIIAPRTLCVNIISQVPHQVVLIGIESFGKNTANCELQGRALSIKRTGERVFFFSLSLCRIGPMMQEASWIHAECFIVIRFRHNMRTEIFFGAGDDFFWLRYATNGFVLYVGCFAAVCRTCYYLFITCDKQTVSSPFDSFPHLSLFQLNSASPIFVPDSLIP